MENNFSRSFSFFPFVRFSLLSEKLSDGTLGIILNACEICVYTTFERSARYRRTHPIKKGREHNMTGLVGAVYANSFIKSLIQILVQHNSRLLSRNMQKAN